MRALWTAALLTASLSLHVQALEDVIYKKDGSVLRGTLVEQDFENGRYKIQLQGGSLFSVSKDDIEKITKEKSYSQTESDLNAVAAESKATLNSQQPINIHIENNPSINQTASINPEQSQKPNHKHVFFIGSMGKAFLITDEYGYEEGASYGGLNLGYQYIFNEHFAFYTAINTGKQQTYIYNGVEEDISDNPDRPSYRSIEFDALASTNMYEGWQFYTGLGLFNEKYSSNWGSSSVSGSNFILGLGYSWETLQAQLRIAVNNSSDYEDDETHSSSALQLGFNF